MRRNNRNRVRRRPARRGRGGPMQPAALRKPTSFRLGTTVSSGMFRLSDSVTLSSGSNGNLYVSVDRSYTQFAESVPLSQLYGQVRLLAFEIKLVPNTLSYAGGTSGTVDCAFAIGTDLTTDLSAPSDERRVLALPDVKTIQVTGRVTPYVFRSAIPVRGYMFTEFSDENAYTYAGCPGSIKIANVIPAAVEASVVIFSCIITGLYQFTSRVFTSTPEEKSLPQSGFILRSREKEMSALVGKMERLSTEGVLPKDPRGKTDTEVVIPPSKAEGKMTELRIE